MTVHHMLEGCQMEGTPRDSHADQRLCQSVLLSFREIEARCRPLSSVKDLSNAPERCTETAVMPGPPVRRGEARRITHSTSGVSPRYSAESSFPHGDPPWRPSLPALKAQTPKSAASLCVSPEMLSDTESANEQLPEGRMRRPTAQPAKSDAPQFDSMPTLAHEVILDNESFKKTEDIASPFDVGEAQNVLKDTAPRTPISPKTQRKSISRVPSIGSNMEIEQALLQGTVLWVKLSLSVQDLRSIAKNASGEIFLVALQKGREAGRTCNIPSSLQPSWDVQLKLRRDVKVTMQCWNRTNDTGEEVLLGEVDARAADVVAEGTEITLLHQEAPCGTIRVRRSTILTHSLEEGSSVVCMLKERVFHAEGCGAHFDDRGHHESGIDYARFYIFRVHNLQQRLGVKYTTVPNSVAGNMGTAILDLHYKSSTGVAYFESGSSLSFIDVEIHNDDRWEPIREFDLHLVDVVEGIGIIGILETCTCVIVDDDLYPKKCDRPEYQHAHAAEKILPSCLNVDKYLTVDEVSDFDLIHGFFLERVKSLWPFSMWAFIWSMYRALYHVTMALILILFIDNVWSEPVSSDQLPADYDFEKNKQERVYRMILAGILSALVVLMTIIQSCGLTGKQLRDWIVAQLLWADDGRLSMMRTADYLNAATTEVETVAETYEQLFVAIEKMAHMTLNIILIICIVPIATPVIVLLIPLSVIVHRNRSQRTRELLMYRLKCQRQYVSTLADVVENCGIMRGMGAENIRQEFSLDTRRFSEAHLTAVKFSVTTKEQIELGQGILVAAIFLCSAVLVNNGTMTKGQAAGLIQAFLSGSADVIFLNAIIVKLKFCTEGLRMVSRILNFPTDAHTLAASSQHNNVAFQNHMKRAVFSAYAAEEENFRSASSYPGSHSAIGQTIQSPHSPRRTLMNTSEGQEEIEGWQQWGAQNGPTIGHEMAAAILPRSPMSRHDAKDSQIRNRISGNLRDHSIQDHSVSVEFHAGEDSERASEEWAEGWKERDSVRESCSIACLLGEGREDEESLEWMNTVTVQDALHVSSGRMSLRSARINQEMFDVESDVHSVEEVDLKDDLQWAEGLDVINDKQWKGPEKSSAMKTLSRMRVSVTFRLGGLVSFKGPSDEAAEMLFKLVVGMQINGKEDSGGSVYVPPYLKYAFCPEIPVLFEGSILKNLLLGARHAAHGSMPTDDEAWQLAKLCGLHAEFLGAPNTFNVGKGGRNLPICARQSICIARSLMSDPSVLFMHKPVALLPDQQARQVLAVLKDFVDYGGLWALLSRVRRPHSTSPTYYILGNGTRTVVMTGVTEQDSLGVNARSVHFNCRWDAFDEQSAMFQTESPLHAPNIKSGMEYFKDMMYRGRNSAPNIFSSPEKLRSKTIVVKSKHRPSNCAKTLQGSDQTVEKKDGVLSSIRVTLKKSASMFTSPCTKGGLMQDEPGPITSLSSRAITPVTAINPESFWSDSFSLPAGEQC